MPLPSPIRLVRPALVAVAALVSAGCGGSGHYPIRGQVVWADGSPAGQLSGGLVVFSSQTTNISASGAIEPDGTFRLNCLKDDDGLPPGTYSVTVSPAEVVLSEFANASARKAARDALRLLPAKYGHPLDLAAKGDCRAEGEPDHSQAGQEPGLTTGRKTNANFDLKSH
jgi:hypothetical protein